MGSEIQVKSRYCLSKDALQLKKTENGIEKYNNDFNLFDEPKTKDYWLEEFWMHTAYLLPD